MPAESAMTPLGRELLDELPSWVREDPLARAVCHVWARESERMGETAERVRDNLIPARADELGLPWWERLLRVAEDPTGKPVAERVEEVQELIRQTLPDPSGSRWQEGITKLIGSGWTYEEGPAPGVITITSPLEPGSETRVRLELLAREITPAAWTVNLVSGEGFILDQSQMDAEPFHGD